MRKTIAFVVLTLAAGLSAAQNGQQVYEKYCQSCHMLQPPMDRQKMMQMPMHERRMHMREMMKKMKAPPMAKVSAKLKHDFGNDRTKIVNFIEDYITHPGAEKARCMPRALKRFGVMPPVGQSLTPAERHAVAEWIVDNFHETWQISEGMGNEKGCMRGKE